jgi:lipoprotein signal peptidase
MDSPRKGAPLLLRSVTIFLLVSADYASKALVQTRLFPGKSIALIGKVLRITYVQNHSGFSWFVPQLPAWVHAGFQAFLLLLAILAFPVYLFYTHTRYHTLWIDAAFMCLEASLLGHSVVDAFFPYTVDFLQVFRSPSANFADLYAYIGIGALLIEIAQVLSHQQFRWRGVNQHLVDMANTRKEFFDFIRKGLRRDH